jgi:hypothetical protein
VSTQSRPHRLRLVLVAIAIGAGSSVVAAANEEAPDSKLSREIRGDLERGRYIEARAQAASAANRYPNSGLLQRRLAQSELCYALDLDFRFRQVSEDLRYSKTLKRVVQMLVEPDLSHEPTQSGRELIQESFASASKEILTPRVLDAIDGFHLNSRARFIGSGALVAEYQESLTAAFRALKKASELGDASAELKLTRLWTQVAALVWMQQAKDIREALDLQPRPAMPKAQAGKSDLNDEACARLKQLEE